MTGPCSRIESSVVVGIPNKQTAMDFMIAKYALNKKIHEATQKTTGPKSLKQRPSGAVGKLSQEQLDELQKQVGPSAHENSSRKKINALKDLSTQLQDAGHTETDHHRSLHHHHHRGAPNHIGKRERNSWRPSITCLNRNAKKVRKEQRSKRYIRARLVTRLAQGGYGSRCAKFVAEKEQSLLADMVEFADLPSASFDKIADRPRHRLPEQFRDAGFLQDEQPHRESQARQVDWCHGMGGAR